jgi:NAD(P)-dependent dehydrogenase (short-subunit alcohol dehydrogenase family)
MMAAFPRLVKCFFHKKSTSGAYRFHYTCFMKSFEGKVVLVTGGSAGIGRATALAFAAEGARVAIAARRAIESEAVVKEIAALGGEAVFIQTDISQSAQVERMVKTTVDRWGRLDCAFNNAGVIGTAFVPTPAYELDAWDQVIAINLTGVFLSMKYEIPAMLANGGGAIVNMSSVAGQIGGAVGIAYFASKHGVIGATRAASSEFSAKGVRVNAVCPAIIKTDMADTFPPEAQASLIGMHPIGRFGELEEVAQTVLFLCSDKASFITGHAMAVDGGLLAR